MTVIDFELQNTLWESDRKRQVNNEESKHVTNNDLVYHDYDRADKFHTSEVIGQI